MPLYLFLIGLGMGIADLVPGISGGTIAFIAGIYEALLENIKKIQLKFYKEAFQFLVPLFCGIGVSLLLFSRLIYFLLAESPSLLFGLFFGMTLASIFLYAKKLHDRKPIHYILFIAGAIISYFLSRIPFTIELLHSGNSLMVAAGLLAAAALLLPGISGSFVLQVMGVYPLILYSLHRPFQMESLKILCFFALGVALGLMIFSRLISLLLKHYQAITLSFLLGFMSGGLKTIWPFSSQEIFFPLLTLIFGFTMLLFIESKRFKTITR